MTARHGIHKKFGWLAITLALLASTVLSAVGQTGSNSSSPAVAKPEDQANETRVLFIGNSFTYVNDLPAMLTKLAQAGGQKPLVCARETPGGCSFEKHWKDGKALKAIQSRKWDYVVLQEVSNGPVTNKAGMFEYARKLNEAVTTQGAKTLLYMTWAWPKPDTQPVITLAYQELAKDLNARLVPVGIAWDATLKAHPAIGLFAKDNHHPSPAGTYLAACAFYAVIYGRSPEGLPATVKDLKDTDTGALQKQANAAAQGNPADIPVNKP